MVATRQPPPVERRPRRRRRRSRRSHRRPRRTPRGPSGPACGRVAAGPTTGTGPVGPTGAVPPELPAASGTSAAVRDRDPPTGWGARLGPLVRSRTGRHPVRRRARQRRRLGGREGLAAGGVDGEGLGSSRARARGRSRAGRRGRSRAGRARGSGLAVGSTLGDADGSGLGVGSGLAAHWLGIGTRRGIGAGRGAWAMAREPARAAARARRMPPGWAWVGDRRGLASGLARARLRAGRGIGTGRGARVHAGRGIGAPPRGGAGSTAGDGSPATTVALDAVDLVVALRGVHGLDEGPRAVGVPGTHHVDARFRARTSRHRCRPGRCGMEVRADALPPGSLCCRPGRSSGPGCCCMDPSAARRHRRRSRPTG